MFMLKKKFCMLKNQDKSDKKEMICVTSLLKSNISIYESI